MAAPGEVRRNPGNPTQVAVGTAGSISAGDWFLFDSARGGYYTNGEHEGVEEWPVLHE